MQFYFILFTFFFFGLKSSGSLANKNILRFFFFSSLDFLFIRNDGIFTFHAEIVERRRRISGSLILAFSLLSVTMISSPVGTTTKKKKFFFFFFFPVGGVETESAASGRRNGNNIGDCMHLANG